jgi:hypothetical protein
LDSANGVGAARHGREQAVTVGADEDGSEFAPHGGEMLNPERATLVCRSGHQLSDVPSWADGLHT